MLTVLGYHSSDAEKSRHQELKTAGYITIVTSLVTIREEKREIYACLLTASCLVLHCALLRTPCLGECYRSQWDGPSQYPRGMPIDLLSVGNFSLRIFPGDFKLCQVDK